MCASHLCVLFLSFLGPSSQDLCTESLQDVASMPEPHVLLSIFNSAIAHGLYQGRSTGKRDNGLTPLTFVSKKHI